MNRGSLIRSMLKLASLCMVKQYEKLELLPDEYDENPVYNSFGVLWGQSGQLLRLVLRSHG